MSTIVLPPDMPLALTDEDFHARQSGLEIVVASDEASVAEELATPNEPVVFVCPYSNWRDKYLDSLSAGDWVTATGAGFDSFPVEEFSRQGISFTNTPGIAGEAMSEHVFGMAFAFSRRLFEYRKQQEAKRWNRLLDELTDFAGDICCVIGLGNVGEPIAERADAFGMVVRGVKRDISGYDGSAHIVYPEDELLEALDQARLVVVAVPLTASTTDLIDRSAFSAVADNAVIVNVARGGVVNESDLLLALDNNDILAAGLDVFEDEPLPKNSPLWERDDVIITPHCAATSDKYSGRFLTTFFNQYNNWEKGGKLENKIE